jgi:ribosomal protein S18 acetylase RimI-like enzyme
MTAPAISIHVVALETAMLLDDVDDDVFDHPVRPELLRAYLADPDNVLVVAVVEGRVVGMATGVAYVHPDKPLALFINEVGVSSRFHRLGIGRMLVQRILAWGGEHGCTEAWVATEVSNAAACRLYESAGGIEDKEHAVVYVFRVPQPSVADSPTDERKHP